jgi:hypothetical protein
LFASRVPAEGHAPVQRGPEDLPKTTFASREPQAASRGNG